MTCRTKKLLKTFAKGAAPCGDLLLSEFKCPLEQAVRESWDQQHALPHHERALHKTIKSRQAVQVRSPCHPSCKSGGWGDFQSGDLRTRQVATGIFRVTPKKEISHGKANIKVAGASCCSLDHLERLSATRSRGIVSALARTRGTGVWRYSRARASGGPDSTSGVSKLTAALAAGVGFHRHCNGISAGSDLGPTSCFAANKRDSHFDCFFFSKRGSFNN